jgi:peptide/nickel transport system substrate-binding protein
MVLASDEPPLATNHKNRPHINPNLPNLLQEDPFYAVTLPKMLGKDFKPRGTFHNATIGKPHTLHPFNNFSHISTWTTMCSAALSKNQFGKYETMAPDMAIKIEERINPSTQGTEFWIHLREGCFWEPLNTSLFSENINLAPHFLKKHPVTSSDFKLYFDAIMNPYNQEPKAISLRTYYDDIEEFRIIDDLTFVVRWKAQEVKDDNGKAVFKTKYIAKSLTGGLTPLASFVYKYFPDGKKIVEDDSDPETYRNNPVWAQNFSQHWAKNIIPSCGGWVFDGMTDRQIQFKRNKNFYEPLAVLAENMVVEFKSTPESMWKDFKINSLDSYNLLPDQQNEFDEFMKSDQYLKQAAQGDTINLITYLGRSYSYIGWNQTTPYFKSKKVRQAMTMAIDRERIINQILNGMGVEVTGTFYKYSPSYDNSIKPFPYDPQEAKELLEEEGWYDSDGDGIVDKMIDGKRVPFEFGLTYYVKNPTSKSICEYVSTALKEIGVRCNLNGMDIADLSAKVEEKSFDALFLAWALGSPPEDPKQLWHSEGAKQQGSSNSTGFANEEVDKIIMQLQYEDNLEKRIALYHRFNAILHDEQPYTFLFSQKTALAYREYLQNVFIPAERQDLIPGANVAEPDPSIYWLKRGAQK